MQNLVGKYIEFLVKDPEIPRKIAVFTRAAIALRNPKKFSGTSLRNFRTQMWNRFPNFVWECGYLETGCATQ